MTREPEFLLSILRRFLSSLGAVSDRPGRSQSALAVDTTSLDWPALLNLADAHAVTPMLYSVLRDTPAPQDFAGQLRSRFENSVRHSLALSGELARLAAL